LSSWRETAYLEPARKPLAEALNKHSHDLEPAQVLVFRGLPFTDFPFSASSSRSLSAPALSAIAQAGRVAALAPYRLSGYLWCFQAEKPMPLIQVDMFEGRTPEIKREFVEAVTRETCRVLKCEPGAVQIILRDVKKSDWASSGVLWSEKK
jgi:4-oxalocrotonate tautomerase